MADSTRSIVSAVRKVLEPDNLNLSQHVNQDAAAKMAGLIPTNPAAYSDRIQRENVLDDLLDVCYDELESPVQRNRTLLILGMAGLEHHDHYGCDSEERKSILELSARVFEEAEQFYSGNYYTSFHAGRVNRQLAQSCRDRHEDKERVICLQAAAITQFSFVARNEDAPILLRKLSTQNLICLCEAQASEFTDARRKILQERCEQEKQRLIDLDQNEQTSLSSLPSLRSSADLEDSQQARPTQLMQQTC